MNSSKGRIIIIGAMSEAAKANIEKALESHTEILPIPEDVTVVVVSGSCGVPGKVIAEEVRAMNGNLTIETPDLPYIQIALKSIKISKPRNFDRRYLPKFNNSKNKRRR